MQIESSFMSSTPSNLSQTSKTWVCQIWHSKKLLFIPPWVDCRLVVLVAEIKKNQVSIQSENRLVLCLISSHFSYRISRCTAKRKRREKIELEYRNRLYIHTFSNIPRRSSKIVSKFAIIAFLKLEMLMICNWWRHICRMCFLPTPKVDTVE